MKGGIHTLKVWLQAFLHLFYPRQCVVCGAALQEGEEVMCLACNMNMPRTDYHLKPDNRMEQLFWGKMPLERAASYFFYHKQSPYAHLIHRLKYDGRRDVGKAMGRLLAAEIQPSGFFRDIDVIVPVPLHPDKQRQRGYNQSECIARGVAAVTGIPVDTTSVERLRHTVTQTHQSVYGRWENVQGVFTLRSSGRFAGKHVLLVDDVLTTGATLTACVDAFAGLEGVRFSVLTLSVAGE